MINRSLYKIINLNITQSFISNYTYKNFLKAHMHKKKLKTKSLNKYKNSYVIKKY